MGYSTSVSWQQNPFSMSLILVKKYPYPRYYMELHIGNIWFVIVSVSNRCCKRLYLQLDEDEDFVDVLNPCTKKEVAALGDSNMRNLKRNDIVQLERKGYFRCDVPFLRPSKPMVLYAIPDGRQQSLLK